jgi:uncharacterized protein YkwD
MVKGYCDYHLCGKKREVEQCPHCKKYFCSEHINPIEPGSYHPEKSRVFVNQIRLGHENTHPCPDYVDYLKQQKKIQGAKWGRALDKLTGRTPKVEELEEDESTIYQDSKGRKDEENEPYLYRYISPEEKSRHPPKVQEKYKKEQVVFERESYIKSFFNKAKRYLRNNYHKIKFWLRNRPHRAYNNWHAIFINIVWIVSLSIIFLIIYSNLAKLNDIVLWFLPLGGTLLVIVLFFWIKYIIKIFKRAYYWFHGERNGIRYIIILILLLILWQAYQYRDTIFNPVIDFYDRTDFSAILPIGISDSIPEKSVFSSKSVNSIKETVEEKVSDIVSSEPISQKTMDVEKSILKYTNMERKAKGLRELQWDARLAEVARDHSLDMVQNDFFSHDNLKGEDPTARAIRHNYNVHKELAGGWYSDGIAENIGKMPTGSIQGGGYVSSDADSIGKAHVGSWMESQGHRANILDSDYIRLGVGVAYDGVYYVATQNFW